MTTDERPTTTATGAPDDDYFDYKPVPPKATYRLICETPERHARLLAIERALAALPEPVVSCGYVLVCANCGATADSLGPVTHDPDCSWLAVAALQQGAGE